ncbi:hypothetical protein MLD38_005799 [Melastoma candidum]|uniref:Uncharacterized protein n=1 Tax=Melastoma candidum TaxID=119954 RepID=A0ACB9RKA7_9MYRT|nr:hypothetical protein MLD38_005799 [Melastoma candidum]
MDESSVTSETVQELVAGGGAVPDKYLYKDVPVGSTDPIPLVDIPVVDLSLLLSPSSPSAGDELDKLRLALATWGCFQAVNHGMSSSFLGRVREITQGVFGLPAEEKRRISRAVDNNEGYGTDTVLFEEQVLDWTDRLCLTLLPEDRRKMRFWPEKPECFREVLHEYSTKLSEVSEIILRAMAVSLKLEEGSFLDQFGAPGTFLARFNYYPRCPRPDAVLGLKPHADGSVLTFVLPDKEVDGLQFLKEGEWLGIRIIPDALVINAGDQAEIMSNGAFKSPMHRAAINAYRDRISIAVFCCPLSEKEVGPISELIGDATPRLYRNVKNYTETNFQYYQSGRRAIEAVKI